MVDKETYIRAKLIEHYPAMTKETLDFLVRSYLRNPENAEKNMSFFSWMKSNE